MIRVILERLEKRFGAIAAVDGVSLELRPGEVTYVLGPPGAGKTTLARLVTGLETLDDGEIYFGDRLVHQLPPHERGVGMVFEDFGLWPGLTVQDNVGYPLKVQKMARPERKRRVSELLTALRIDSLAGRRPESLTPQQRLRTALARALVTQPDFLVLDQPLGSLESRTREECWDDLRRIHAEAGVTILILTDDPVEALALADRLAVLDLGRVLQSGTPQELYSRPLDVFVARMLGPTNLLQGQIETQVTEAKGEVVVRTPLGRLIGQMIPGPTGPGAPVTISVRPRRFHSGPARLRVGTDFRQPSNESSSEASCARSTHGPGDWPIIVSALQSQSQSLREGQSLTLSVAPEHVVVLPGKFSVGSRQ